ncbi:hypothetical protein GCM10023314_30240 [Algibacter agarivorans]|uniref:Glycosyl hydrolase family 13 catalytic domain-containing protein n=1 Tax=Algibacter agarivorans TaxID=1109741 RepID=A0ABP9GWD0_9FLAO
MKNLKKQYLFLVLITYSIISCNSNKSLEPKPSSLRSSTSQQKTGSPESIPNWLTEAVFYQIYPQSFKDSDGDGIGDIKGIIEKVDYIQSLGIDAVWFNGSRTIVVFKQKFGSISKVVCELKI